MESTYKEQIIKEIINATQFINCYAMFNIIKKKYSLNEEDFEKYIDYCESKKYLEKQYFPFNNNGVEEIIYECITTSEGAEFLYKK